MRWTSEKTAGTVVSVQQFFHEATQGLIASACCSEEQSQSLGRFLFNRFQKDRHRLYVQIVHSALFPPHITMRHETQKARPALNA
jgi:hypothetical protein